MLLYRIFYLLLFFVTPFSWANYNPPPESQETFLGKTEDFCPQTAKVKWRKGYQIEDVTIAPSPVCQPDNPFAVAAFVKGTNNISMQTLMETHLALDSVTKGRDLDGDGDPDEIHIRLEVIELNGFSPDLGKAVTTYNIAPGVQPGFWAFAPKSRGMSTLSYASAVANPLLRLPSPAIRVEQNDHVIVTLENSHYFPHSIHFHGVDHPFKKDNGKGNDGVPQISNKLLMPGKQFDYEFTPRQPGTMVYHCHVQAHTHILMGLIGMFIVEENRPNNWVQTFNIGNSFVRHSSVAIKENYNREYDLQYQDVDKELHHLIQTSNDSRLLAKAFNRDYNISQRKPEYFILNGRSYPYTLRESLIVVKPEEKIKLRVFNAGEQLLALHTHGFKPIVTHYDGVKLNSDNQIQRDVFTLGPSQRVDLSLYTHNDGLNNVGEGIWTYHDHNEIGVTTDGIYPGGNISAIVFDSFLGEKGQPKLQGVDITPFFSADFYQRRYPLWTLSDSNKFYAEINTSAKDLKNSSEMENSFNLTQISVLVLQIIILLATLFLFFSYANKNKNN
jgi:FtsP/CotA-like multicopper oxidase with cupredoxin domain